MNKLSFKKIIFIIFSLLICFLGLFLRSKNYAAVPIPGESRDEISFSWLGLSLIETGRPIATSGLNPYSHNWKYINNSDIFHNFANPNPFPIDSPWFDHPPLFSLIPGAYAHFKGIDKFADTSISIVRRPMLFIGAFNILLIIILGTIIFNHKIGLIAGLIYATDPLIVVSSRMVQAENFLITIFLLAIISYYVYRRSKKYFYFWLAVSLSGLATLVKLSGISVGISLLVLNLILESKDKIKKSLVIILGTGLITLLFPLYGALYNWPLFKDVFFSNSSRYFRDGLAGFYSLITQTNITRTFIDGWVLLAWICIFFISSRLSKAKKLWFLIVPTFSYLFVYLIFGSEGYGWYKFPFYPFIFLAIAWVFNYFLKKNNSFFGLFSLLLSGGVLLNKFLPPEKLKDFIWTFRFGCFFIFALILLPYLKIPNFPQKKYSHFILWFFFALCLLINIWVNLQINVDAWYKIR